MKLTLRNLGRLREATIDLDKDLILLTGPNNTSKTYVAHALYGFGKESFSDTTVAARIVLDELAPGNPETEQRFGFDVIEFVERFLPRLLEEKARAFLTDLAEILASSEEFVARTEVKLELGAEQLARAKHDLLALEEKHVLKEMGMTELKSAGSPIWNFDRLPRASAAGGGGAPSPSRGLLSMRVFASARLGSVLDTHLLRIPPHTHVLTAERAAIQLFSRELSLKRTELVDDLLKLKSGPRVDAGQAIENALEQRAQRYPLAIQDGLLIANDLARFKAVNSSFAPLAEQLERGLLGGAIRIDEQGEMSFQPNDSDAHLSLHLSSSSVKSLAGLSFFLRHIAKRGQFLIIDEPELNLHPDNQRKVARVLARLVRSGIKVLISTHSDYIIRELNNLIMLSADKDGSVRQRLGYDEGETLSPEQVGAYLFDSEKANPITVTPTGIEVATIEREINALNAVSQDIYFTLFGGTGG
ncbi:ATP-binding protein [Archangium gephyra]|uniref:AAA family ATPase n=1 Tax=Archangium gephyra TaxID=48 RepID=UPI0035D5065A